ncbi:biotin--[acetyl-CoA-carboxylase] ligase [Anabaena subtropica]|uniref:Biotin--[acetyl-CoA-carboxylase] ligase n=1 Tax=Anabaena subtropica FACHB-260 TaxID=2692884 RepID=A0ABR8CL85_9NOST|nr:biotin--[acetyl-CoA-carboxylase] ligase [Anabaena subtropica]MBD2343930.1 biotin--[acetyl-CoA-carboxylase] ligase [Anabaena subtropica FACHB-260]
MAEEFNQQKLESALQAGRKYAYLPFSLHIFSSVASTNRTLWELIDQGAGIGSVVIATQQTAGRGQWGRQWVSPTGGLYVSVAITPKLAANASYQLTLASAWGIAAQLRASGVNVGIKWPNDLVLDGRKLGGILTETKVNQGYISQAVVGVGINWSNPVPETGINLKSWQSHQENQPISCLETLTSKVLLGIESGMTCLFQEGISILLSRYSELLVNMGDRVHVNDVSGIVVGVTPQGDLRVSLETDCVTDIKTPELYLEPGTISLGYRRSLGTY